MPVLPGMKTACVVKSFDCMPGGGVAVTIGPVPPRPALVQSDQLPLWFRLLTGATAWRLKAISAAIIDLL